MYLLSLGAVCEADVNRLFRWDPDEIKKVLQSLEAERIISSNIQIEGQSVNWIAHVNLLENA
jgi:hypothetical protein